MPWTVTPEFPHGLSDEELAEAVTAISEGFYGASGQLVEMKEVPQLRLAMLQAALQEQSRRLVQEANRQSQRATRRATVATVVSLVIAAVALGVAAFGTVSDYFGDRDWQNDQTRILEEIRDQGR